MHKHRKNKQGSNRWRNANSRLSQSATDAVKRLTESFDWEDESVRYLQSEYLSKFLSEDLVPADLRRSRAIEKWLATESVNAVTNDRIRNLDPGYNIMPRVTYSAFLRFARRLISQVLGPLRDSVTLGSFSGGASTSRRRASSLPAMKFTGLADATSEALTYIDVIHREAPLLKQYGVFYGVRTVEGAILFTVPKKTDIDRCACKEPDINMYLQKGVGRYIRSRLLSFGINLNDQSINRKLAHRGSILNDLATIDLSSASDTITIECVKALLPTDWFLYLNDIRSQQVLVDGKYVRTEMFSSMGNGFTFELESLIFWALVRTVSYFEGISGVVSVYGDDIICPSGAYDMVSWVLREFGFTINPEKSFHTGPFRESCGGHYHNGHDITPFYLKREATHLTDVIRVANQFRRWATADPSRPYMSDTTYKMWSNLAQYVPKVLWGGYDLNSDTQLVSPGAPNKQLVRLSSPCKLPADGAYVHWHNTNWKRSLVDEVSYDPRSTNQICRLRRASKGAPHCENLFFEEIIESGTA